MAHIMGIDPSQSQSKAKRGRPRKHPEASEAPLGDEAPVAPPLQLDPGVYAAQSLGRRCPPKPSSAPIETLRPLPAPATPGAMCVDQLAVSLSVLPQVSSRFASLLKGPLIDLNSFCQIVVPRAW